MRIGIIGPGRLGRSLAALLAPHPVTVTLSGRGETPGHADLYLLTVPDAAVAAAASSVPLGPPLLHCSGALDVDVLRPRRPVGSFHPLMTFPGPEVALPELQGVPVAVAGDPAAVAEAHRIAEILDLDPFEVPGDRALYHASAVMAGNFATVLLADAARVLTAAGVDPDRASGLLAPLAIASLRNAAGDPSAALTGPAARGDRGTIERHLAALRREGFHDIADLYAILTERAQTLKNH